MRSSARPLAALAGGLVALAMAVTTAAPAALAAAPTGTAATPYFVGGYVPSGHVVTAASQLRSAGAYAGAYAEEFLPDSVDLRANAPAVGNQGSIGACVAWTIGYSLMGYYAQVSGGSGAPYAPLYLYLRSVNGAPPNAGVVPETALSVATKSGVDTQSDYFQGTTNYSVTPTSAEIANAANYRLSGYTTLWSGSGNQGAAGQFMIEHALAAGSPVAIGFPVFSDFPKLKGSTVYNTLSGTSIGGHMVAVYGYDSNGIWIRNSWTTAWGASGDAELSWAFVNKLVSAAFTVSGLNTSDSQHIPAPTVVSLSAKTGSTTAGGTVTLGGTGLASATGVKFGDKAATFTPTVVNGVTQLAVTVPAHAAGTVDVTVTNPSGTSVAVIADKFTYSAPVPTVTRLDPATSVVFGGKKVTLTGTALTGAKSLRVGSTPVSSFTVVSDTSLTFVTPKAAAGPLHVTVTTSGGTSKPGADDVLTYVNPPAPTVTSLSASSGKSITTNTVKVTGTNFTGTSAVVVGGVRATFTPVSDTQLSVVVPRHAAGTSDVQVTTPGGASAVSDASKYTWVAPATPILAGLSVTTGPAKKTSTVTLTGSGFTDATAVLVGSTTVRPTVVSDSTITVTLPAKPAGTVTLRVIGPGGTSNDVQFQYV